ncbi:hypothetical protein VB773_10390 [Haloarculaceae archaeon H-GB2-1]|nr:hypothetical protein [Haloarculaceae archaeon H-GB1-1]MEA5386416.1 hypothetical protein [Haloarculaceae archaeon H-GB11]MEA5407926.1 hypothetical protein [Haloarculaceae archaeon H-GB2-1]
MDAESTLAILWLCVGVAGPLVMIYGAVLVVGWEVSPGFEFYVTAGVVLASFAWVVYCTWQIQLVSGPTKADIQEWERQ